MWTDLFVNTSAIEEAYVLVSMIPVVQGYNTLDYTWYTRLLIHFLERPAHSGKVCWTLMLTSTIPDGRQKRD